MDRLQTYTGLVEGPTARERFPAMMVSNGREALNSDRVQRIPRKKKREDRKDSLND